MSVLRDPAIDVVIELIGGYEPARKFVLAAIANRKDVVTANKALLAVHGEEIVAAAEASGVRVGFEAAVGGGIPILRTLKEGLVGDRTAAVYGIVNGTCNHILTTMTREGRAFDDVLAEAQRLGLAEANPATDVDGVDSAHKLAILATLAFGVRRASPTSRPRASGGSTRSTSRSRASSATRSSSSRSPAGGGRVRSARPPDDDSERPSPGRRVGNFNAIFVRGAALGPTMYYGQGAGSLPTATAVIADLFRRRAIARSGPAFASRRGAFRSERAGRAGGAARGA
jgi:homoserine dehydrogenase